MSDRKQYFDEIVDIAERLEQIAQVDGWDGIPLSDAFWYHLAARLLESHEVIRRNNTDPLREGI